jgi:hypothetical protein
MIGPRHVRLLGKALSSLLGQPDKGQCRVSSLPAPGSG